MTDIEEFLYPPVTDLQRFLYFVIVGDKEGARKAIADVTVEEVEQEVQHLRMRSAEYSRETVLADAAKLTGLCADMLEDLLRRAGVQ